MTATLQTDITASVRWNQQDNDGATARSVIDANAITLIDTLANGTGEDQADVIYHAQLSLTTSPTTLDLTDGTMTDMLGNQCVFDYIRTIMVTVADGGGYVTLAGTFQEYISSPGASSVFDSVACSPLISSPEYVAMRPKTAVMLLVAPCQPSFSRVPCRTASTRFWCSC